MSNVYPKEGTRGTQSRNLDPIRSHTASPSLVIWPSSCETSRRWALRGVVGASQVGGRQIQRAMTDGWIPTHHAPVLGRSIGPNGTPPKNDASSTANARFMDGQTVLGSDDHAAPFSQVRAPAPRERVFRAAPRVMPRAPWARQPRRENLGDPFAS